MTSPVYNLWITVRPAEDIPGEWVGHCLDFDVVSQGHSLVHTVQMVAEAVVMVLQAEAEAGRDPFLRRAPESHWNEMYNVLRTGMRGDLDEVLHEERADNVTLAVIPIELRLHEHEAYRAPIAFRLSA